jgi:hypothetical protein
MADHISPQFASRVRARNTNFVFRISRRHGAKYEIRNSKYFVFRITRPASGTCTSVTSLWALAVLRGPTLPHDTWISFTGGVGYQWVTGHLGRGVSSSGRLKKRWEGRGVCSRQPWCRPLLRGDAWYHQEGVVKLNRPSFARNAWEKVCSSCHRCRLDHRAPASSITTLELAPYLRDRPLHTLQLKIGWRVGRGVSSGAVAQDRLEGRGVWSGCSQVTH